MKPWLGDQVTRDREDEVEIDWSPRGQEPRLNAWLDVVCDTPEGEEEIHYMLVAGPYLRNHLFSDYVEGGHFYRYGWIPEDQIWMEDTMGYLDQICTGIHEIHERYRMKYLGWTYDRAHMSALKVEREIRLLALEENTILPTNDGVKQIFASEGSGKNCERITERLMQESEEKAQAANRQSNNPVGKDYEQ